MPQTAVQPIRPAAVAGLFYPGDGPSLAREIDDFLERSAESEPAPGYPKALIVPHAGYIYSGGVAAEAYDLLRPARGLVTRVVLLGPCHRVAVRGLALPGARAFATPLGEIEIDAEAVKALNTLPQLAEHPATHAQEHALEVQLPFLQQVLGKFKLVPLVVGMAEAQEVARALEQGWGGPETLIVVSSDLSHYHPYEQARAIDQASVQSILDGDGGLSHEQACGATPIGGLMLAARRYGLAPRLIQYRNSGDTAGGRDHVVGYASFAFYSGGEKQPRYEVHHGNMLLSLARAAIGAALSMGARPAVPVEPWLLERRASFVTLTLDGNLRGCIGRLAAERPLGVDVMENARAAATSDPRFAPLSVDELRRCAVEVSLLSTPKRLEFADHAELIAQLQPGRDGLILECEGRRGTFLPQVWKSLPDPENFLAQLKLKSGLSPTTRTERCRVLRYRALKWSEAE